MCPSPWQGIQTPPQPPPAPGRLKCITRQCPVPCPAQGTPRGTGAKRESCWEPAAAGAGSTGGGIQKCRAAGSVPQRPGPPESPAGCSPLDLPLGGLGNSTGAGSHQPPWLQCRSWDPRLCIIPNPCTHSAGQWLLWKWATALVFVSNISETPNLLF